MFHDRLKMLEGLPPPGNGFQRRLRNWLAVKIRQDALDDYAKATHSELHSLASRQRLKDPDAKRGGRKAGYSPNDDGIPWAKVIAEFDSLVAGGASQNEAAREVFEDYWGRNKNGEVPAGDELRAFVKKLKRHRNRLGS